MTHITEKRAHALPRKKSYGEVEGNHIPLVAAQRSAKRVLPRNFDDYDNYRGSPVYRLDKRFCEDPDRPERTEGEGATPGKLSHRALLKGEDMRADVGQDVFVFQVVGKSFPQPVNSNSPTSRIHAYSRTRVNAIISRAFRESPLRPSRRHPRPRSRDKYLYRAHPLRHCDTSAPLGYSCRRLIPKRDTTFRRRACEREFLRCSSESM